MAASRIERFSSIVRRCESLMMGNVIKKKPLWYDVYIKFPPFVEPTILRDVSEVPVREIFYPEDIEMAKKYNVKNQFYMASNGKEFRKFKKDKEAELKKSNEKKVLLDLSEDC